VGEPLFSGRGKEKEKKEKKAKGGKKEN